MRLLFVDIETTGFDRRWDSIIEVAAILYNTDLKKQNHWNYVTDCIFIWKKLNPENAHKHFDSFAGSENLILEKT